MSNVTGKDRALAVKIVTTMESIHNDGFQNYREDYIAQWIAGRVAEETQTLTAERDALREENADLGQLLQAKSFDEASRFEVIDHTATMQGRVLVKHGVKVELSRQDQGKTLKVFLTDQKEQ